MHEKIGMIAVYIFTGVDVSVFVLLGSLTCVISDQSVRRPLVHFLIFIAFFDPLVLGFP